MSLKIFGDQTEQPKAKRFADDLVGRFRSGYVSNKRPVALDKWRVTTGDPEVAQAIAAEFGGDPQTWDAAGEDDQEVFTTAESVDIIIENRKALRQRMILWGRNGKVIRESDGETCTDGTPDPQAGQSLAERKAAAKDGVGAEPQIELFFRLKSNPDLGIFKFQSGSWSLASDLAYHNTEAELAERTANGPVSATLSLEQVSFVAKSGPRVGQTVTYTKPVVKLGAAVEAAPF